MDNVKESKQEEVAIGVEDPVLGLPWGNGGITSKMLEEKFGMKPGEVGGAATRFFGTVYISNVKFLGTPEEQAIRLNKLIINIRDSGYDVRIVEPTPAQLRVVKGLGFKKVFDINLAPTAKKVYGNDEEPLVNKYVRIRDTDKPYEG